ncbi:MAG: segregation/condensation protein A [Patescibacteria group bacterium]
METENTQSYTIKTSAFEGPFGLLLDLIEKKKLFINDLTLAQVTEDYLKFVTELGESKPSDVSSFIVVAATLILIKSKSLLPDLSLTNEEEGDIKSLEERLRLFELFNRLGGNIKSAFGERIIFAPEERKNEVLVFLPDAQITKESMMTLVQDVLGRIPKKTFLPEVEVKKVISIEEMIDKLTERIQGALRMNFREFSGKVTTREEKVTVIVSFLAMLELVRQGILNAVQESHTDDIMIEKQAIQNE